MKKLLHILPLLLLGALLTIGISSCSDDDKDFENIDKTDLPAPAREFINRFFPGEELVRVVKDRGDNPPSYEVSFRSGAKIEFSSTGEWTEVRAALGNKLPSGILLDAISAYIARNYPQQYVIEASKDRRGYDVDLNNGLDLYFDLSGRFLQAEW